MSSDYKQLILCRVAPRSTRDRRMRTDPPILRPAAVALQEMDKQEKVDCKEAVKQQAMPTSKDLNMEPWDSMKVCGH